MCIIVNLSLIARPYSEANTLLFDWHIHSLPQAGATAFWQYLYVKHHTQFARHHVSNEEQENVIVFWMLG